LQTNHFDEKENEVAFLNYLIERKVKTNTPRFESQDSIQLGKMGIARVIS
jgi:hypothetical protein